MCRWAIHIDMEGFSNLWDKEDQILLSLGELMRAIFRIGRKCFPASPERLFAHQLGDGFLIISDFPERELGARCNNCSRSHASCRCVQAASQEPPFLKGRCPIFNPAIQEKYLTRLNPNIQFLCVWG